MMLPGSSHGSICEVYDNEELEYHDISRKAYVGFNVGLNFPRMTVTYLIESLTSPWGQKLQYY